MPDWFNDEWDDFNKPKIVCREIGMQMDACEVSFSAYWNHMLALSAWRKSQVPLEICTVDVV